uniref:Uncharacterized protein n=1 Tax=Meloidogyne enterolobii TaxID=390850 RepID=A0A6V7TZ53_MELEN|nr:unnamed protein product [Meloidogyne enterolobii]
MVAVAGPDWMASTKRWLCLWWWFGGSLHAFGGWWLSSCSWWLVALFMLLVVGSSLHAFGGWWPSTCFWWPASDVMLEYGRVCSTSGMDGMDKAECAPLDGISFWRFSSPLGKGGEFCGEKPGEGRGVVY